MTISEIREAARGPMSAKCRMCPVCDGRACAGQVPGMGGMGTGSSFSANAEALKKLRLNMRVAHGCGKPSLETELFGARLSSPMMAAPMTGARVNCGDSLSEEQFIHAVASGAHRAGTLAWVGDSGAPAFLEAGLEEIKKIGRGVAIIKPYADDDEIVRRMRMSAEAGAVAVGIDLDAAGFVHMAGAGWAVSPKSPDRLRKLRESTRLPFIVKGVMTPDEALLCHEAGVDCIVVSNHGGRVLDCCPGVAEVLPRVAEAAGDKLTVLADGAVRSGTDAFKLMALGARGVLIGRPLCWGAYGKGPEGVAETLSAYAYEFNRAMIMTGCGSVNKISKDVLF